MGTTLGGFIRSVTGDREPEPLGVWNYHEHLFQVSPLLPGDELDDETRSQAETELLRDSGFTAMVDATPLGLGQRPEALARIAQHTGVSIVATTGRHREAHYSPGHWVYGLTEEALSQRFVSDLMDAMMASDDGVQQTRATGPAGEPIRAGVIKAGIDYWRISAFERITLDALAAAHRLTGAPVMIHLEHCSAAHEVLDILASGGVSEPSIVLAHADRSLDPGLHASLIERGAYLGYDGMGRLRNQSDHDLIHLTNAVIEAVGDSRIVLGGDVARSSRYVAYGGMPGLGYLGLRYLPRLRQVIGDAATDRLLGKNPASWLSWSQQH